MEREEKRGAELWTRTDRRAAFVRRGHSFVSLRESESAADWDSDSAAGRAERDWRWLAFVMC